jgi:hypothetical protein
LQDPFRFPCFVQLKLARARSARKRTLDSVGGKSRRTNSTGIQMRATLKRSRSSGSQRSTAGVQ